MRTFIKYLIKLPKSKQPGRGVLLVRSERITIKEGDEAKDRYHRFIDDIAPRNQT